MWDVGLTALTCFEESRLLCRNQGLDDLGHAPFDDLVEGIHGQSDAVVSDPVLGKVIGANTF